MRTSLDLGLLQTNGMEHSCLVDLLWVVAVRCFKSVKSLVGVWWNQVQRDGGVAYLIATHESEPCCKRCADGLLKPRAVCWSKTGHHSDNVFEAERDPTLGVSSLMFQTSVKGARKASSFFARVSLLSVSRDPWLGSTLTHSKLLWVCWRVAHSVLTRA